MATNWIQIIATVKSHAGRGMVKKILSEAIIQHTITHTHTYKSTHTPCRCLRDQRAPPLVLALSPRNSPAVEVKKQRGKVRVKVGKTKEDRGMLNISCSRTITILRCTYTLRHHTLQTSTSGRVGYLKNTFFSSMRPLGRDAGLSPASDSPSMGDALPGMGWDGRRVWCGVVWCGEGR